MYIARVSTGYNNNKEAQLLLENTHYSLYSSCSSTDHQGHPSSMIFYLIWKSEIWLIFRWKNGHFPTSVYSTPILKLFPLHCIPEILYAENTKVSPYDPTLIHNTSVTDRQTDGRTRDRRQ